MSLLLSILTDFSSTLILTNFSSILAMRIVTGAMKSTPIGRMETLTGIQPLNHRREGKVLMQAEKFRSLPNHPMKPKVEGLTKNRLKRSSFVHESKRLLRQHEEDIPRETLPIPPPAIPPIGDDDSFLLDIRTSVPGIIRGEEQTGTMRKALALAMIDEKYPEEAWIQAYTDGSATNAVKDGGAGVYVRFPNGEKKCARIATGDRCSNYNAEIQAMILAAKEVTEIGDPRDPIVILTDAKSVLQELGSRKIATLQKEIQSLQRTRRVCLQWIPAHCGIPGNERADMLAKEGAREEQPSSTPSYLE